MAPDPSTGGPNSRISISAGSAARRSSVSAHRTGSRTVRWGLPTLGKNGMQAGPP